MRHGVRGMGEETADDLPQLRDTPVSGGAVPRLDLGGDQSPEPRLRRVLETGLRAA